MRKMMAFVTAGCVSALMFGGGLAQAADPVRPAKRDAVSVRWVSATPMSGYQAMTLDRDQKVYVAPKAALTACQISAAQVIETRNGAGVMLTLTGQATGRFADQLEKRKAPRVAIVSGNRVLAAGAVSFDAKAGVMTVSDLSSSRAERVAEIWTTGKVLPGGPTITAVPSQRTVAPGGTVTVDMYVSGVADLRVYQVTPEVSGGTSGSLTRVDAVIDSSRPNYVFSAQQKLDAVDQSLGRIGAVLFGNGVNAAQASYLGSYVFQASTNASGEFTVKATEGASSILWNSKNQGLRFITRAATISVGAVQPIAPTDK